VKGSRKVSLKIFFIYFIAEAYQVLLELKQNLNVKYCPRYLEHSYKKPTL